MTDKFYNSKFGEKPAPPWKHEWPSIEEQRQHWIAKEKMGIIDNDPRGRMHRCPQCGCLFTGGEA
jgi:hypothetical protein